MLLSTAKDKALSWESRDQGLGTRSATGLLNDLDQIFASLGLSFPFYQMSGLTSIHDV